MVREKLKALKERIGSDNLGPDRGTRDQLEARKERARIEAQRKREREQRREQIEQAREAGRQEAERPDGFVARLADGIEQATDQLEAAGGDLNEVDIDGDGVGLGDELQDPAGGGLRAQVDDNTEDITELQQEFDGRVFDGGSEQQGGAGFTTDPLAEATAPFETDDSDDGGLF